MNEDPIKIVGLAYKLGSKISTNDSLEKKFKLNKGFILEKTGISKRVYFSKNEDPRNLATDLAKALLRKLKIKENLPIFGSSNPYGKYQIPASTMEIASRLRFKNIPVFHINYGCGGYLGAIESLYNYLSLHKNSTVLLVLTDWPSKMVNTYDTAVLFSDAVHVSVWSNSPKYKGIEIEKVFFENSLENPYALNVKNNMWSMDGKAIVNFVRSVPKIISTKMNINLTDYEIVSHQPNAKLLTTLEHDYHIPFYKKDVENFGNTTCAAMMIAFQNYLKGGKFQKPLLLMGFGDTESYGAVITKKAKDLPIML